MHCAKLLKPKKLWWWIGFVAWLFSVAVFSVTLFLELTPPPSREVHRNLLTLFPAGSPNEYQFKRMDILSDDYLFVGSHGIGSNKEGIQWITDERSGVKRNVSPEQLAEIIVKEKTLRGISADLPIFLLACNAGAGKEPYAYKLSKLLGVAVLAPTEWLVVDHFGISRSGENLLTAYFNYGNLSVRSFSPNDKDAD